MGTGLHVLRHLGRHPRRGCERRLHLPCSHGGLPGCRLSLHDVLGELLNLLVRQGQGGSSGWLHSVVHGLSKFPPTNKLSNDDQ